MYNYSTKSDLKNATGVDTSNEDDLNKLKSIVDELGIDKLKNVPSDARKPVPANLKKLSDIVEKKLLKKMCLMYRLKKLMLFRLLILVI